MSSEGIKVFMFEEDRNNMVKWVLEYPDCETGGDLFGLWSSNNGLNPVIHIVLGPGKGCRRSTTSFFQSVPYLDEVGSFLTQTYMLCHIGEWHSHHRLGLSEPSYGDCRTVQRNLPQGIFGFLLIIANITSVNSVSLSPYLFTEEHKNKPSSSRPYIPCTVKSIRSSGPFRALERIVRKINQGAEKPRPKNTGTSWWHGRSITESTYPSSFPTGRPSVDQFVAPRVSFSGNMLGDSPSRLRGSSVREVNPRYEYSQAPATVNAAQWYSSNYGEMELKRLFRDLKDIPGCENVQMSRDTASHNLTMSLDLRQKRCHLRFPKNYPKSPVTISLYGTGRSGQRATETKHTREKTFKDARREIIGLVSCEWPRFPWQGY